MPVCSAGSKPSDSLDYLAETARKSGPCRSLGQTIFSEHQQANRTFSAHFLHKLDTHLESESEPLLSSCFSPIVSDYHHHDAAPWQAHGSRRAAGTAAASGPMCSVCDRIYFFQQRFCRSEPGLGLLAAQRQSVRFTVCAAPRRLGLTDFPAGEPLNMLGQLNVVPSLGIHPLRVCRRHMHMSASAGAGDK